MVGVRYVTSWAGFILAITTLALLELHLTQLLQDQSDVCSEAASVGDMIDPLRTERSWGLPEVSGIQRGVAPTIDVQNHGASSPSGLWLLAWHAAFIGAVQ